jgi:hypothetical protein
MTFIEQLFGISPDGGTGSLELLLWFAPVVAGAAAFLLARRNRAKR